jgi:hypothetical protein
MCVRIRAAVEADGGAFKFSQIKEKYGSIRVYWDGELSPEAGAQVEEAIALAEARSSTSCEVCGEEGQLYNGAWLTDALRGARRGASADAAPGRLREHAHRTALRRLQEPRPPLRP